MRPFPANKLVHLNFSKWKTPLPLVHVVTCSYQLNLLCVQCNFELQIPTSVLVFAQANRTEKKTISFQRAWHLHHSMYNPDVVQKYDTIINAFPNLPAKQTYRHPFAQSCCTYQCYSDVNWASWCLKSPTVRLFLQQFPQANVEENIKHMHYRFFVKEIHQSSMDSPHKGSVIPCPDVIDAGYHLCWLPKLFHFLV